MNYWLGIDCGGTFIKAAIYDKDGKEYSCSKQITHIVSHNPGWAERDLDELWQTCTSTIKKSILISGVDPKLIKGIGISAQGKGLFPLDLEGNPFKTGYLSSDQRSLSIVQQWQKESILNKLYPITYQTLWTGHPVSILRWLKDNDINKYNNIGSILMAHDYLRYRLTGEINCELTNISESNLYNMNIENYDVKLANILGIEEVISKLPPIIKSTEIAGYTTKEVEQQTGLIKGTTVVGGLFDVVSSAICSGIKQDEQLNVVLGTWSVVSGVTNNINNESNKLVNFVYGKYINKSQFIVHEASPTSAANLEWFTKQWTNLDYSQINTLVESLPQASSSIFFIPFLYGSNVKLGMKGGLYGIQQSHQISHILQAIYEGVLFSLMQHLEKILIRFPQNKSIRITGGPTKSFIWMQMLANLTGKLIEVPDVEESGCLGAAFAAMIGSGAYEDIDEVYDNISIKLKTIYPDIKLFNRYQHKYKKYQELVNSLSTLDI